MARRSIGKIKACDAMQRKIVAPQALETIAQNPPQQTKHHPLTGLQRAPALCPPEAPLAHQL
ncbi:hypothetical protein [Novosphingobium sp. SG751A]|uniref:hypothetical protein n=1 Tax=Novosphingobium sp. SG751A TaxID=2587000 RepID=UPI001554EF40|nr:hypothetical protein [Novosphingobium sp. SG751A]